MVKGKKEGQPFGLPFFDPYGPLRADFFDIGQRRYRSSLAPKPPDHRAVGEEMAR